MAQVSYHIEDINGLGDLQIDWKFEIKFIPKNAATFQAALAEYVPSVAGRALITNNILNPNKTYGTNQVPMFTMFARSIDFPGRSNGTIEDDFQGWKTIFPGKPDFGGNEFTVTFAERQDLGVLRAIYAWQELINKTRRDTNLQDSFQDFDDFKNNLTGTIQVTMCTTDGNLNGVSGFYYNCWPKDRSSLSLDMSSEDKVSPEIVFAFDWNEIAPYS